MLFFLLPWYYKSATLGRANMYFVIILALCTVLATLDIVFDRFLMRVRILASIYYTIALFSCLNLAIPALLLCLLPHVCSWLLGYRSSWFGHSIHPCA